MNTPEKEANEIASPFKELSEEAGNTPLAPAHGIAAIALSMALKYHDINMVKDGALYQQYKIEGRNLKDLHLDEVFETAIRMELHLLGSSDRIAAVVVNALEARMDESEGEDKPEAEGG